MTTCHDRSVSIVEGFKTAYLSRTAANNFDRELWENIEIDSAHADPTACHASARFSITVPPSYANHLGTFHGGAISTLFDGMTSSILALLGENSHWDGTEFSRSMVITFFKPVPLGQRLSAECETVHVGSRLATIRGTISCADDGEVLAVCQHDKYNLKGRAKL